MSIKPVFDSDSYPDGKTKQSFKDSTDVNKLLLKHARAGTLSHLERFGGQYGSFVGFDFQEAQNRISRATTIFEQLPWETRQDFGNDPGAFFAYVATKTPAELRKELPELAKPGVQWPNPTGQRVPKKPPEAASEAQPSVPPTPPAESQPAS